MPRQVRRAALTDGQDFSLLLAMICAGLVTPGGSFRTQAWLRRPEAVTDLAEEPSAGSRDRGGRGRSSTVTCSIRKAKDPRRAHLRAPRRTPRAIRRLVRRYITTMGIIAMMSPANWGPRST